MKLLAMLTDRTGSTKNQKFSYNPDPVSVNTIASPSLESAKNAFEQVSKFKSVCYEFLCSCKSARFGACLIEKVHVTLFSCIF